MQEVAIDLVAGTIGGCSGIAVGQPLDFVKVQLQARKFTNASQCVYQSVSRAGPLVLFKGMAPPLIANAPLNAILFATYNGTCNLLGQRYPAEKDSLLFVFLAGCVSGTCLTPLITSSEVIKCRAQVGELSSPQVGLSIVRQHGARGLFVGMAPTAIANIPGYGICFAVYEDVKRRMRVPGSEKDTATAVIVAGSTSGVVSWIFSYPFDVVKTIVQTSDRPTSMHEVVRHGLHAEGLTFLTRGIMTVVVRSIPVQAMTFFAYEYSKQLLEKMHALQT